MLPSWPWIVAIKVSAYLHDLPKLCMGQDTRLRISLLAFLPWASTCSKMASYLGRGELPKPQFRLCMMMAPPLPTEQLVRLARARRSAGTWLWGDLQSTPPERLPHQEGLDYTY